MATTNTATAPAEQSTIKSDQTALAKREDAPLTTPAEYREAVKRFQSQKCNIISPFIALSAIPAGYGILPVVVGVNPDPAGGHVYSKAPWVPAGHVAPGKVMLRLIARSAAIATSVLPLDSPPNIWKVMARASWKDLDGSTVTIERPFEWDLRDGADRIKGWTPNQITEGRKHGLSHCIARATNAIIREYGIKQTYTFEEMSKPFVAMRFVYLPDYKDPETRRVMLANAMAGTSALFAQNAPAALPPPSSRTTAQPSGWFDPLADDEPTQPIKQIGSGPSNPTPATPAAEGDDGPPTPDAVRIVRTEPKSFVTQNGPRKGQPGVRYLITDSTGTEHSTFNKKLYEFAEKCCLEKAWVEIAVSTDGDFKNLDEITLAGQQPSLPGTRNDL